MFVAEYTGQDNDPAGAGAGTGVGTRVGTVVGTGVGDGMGDIPVTTITPPHALLLAHPSIRVYI